MESIHRLHELTLKNADIESLYIVRELRKTAKFPLNEASFREAFVPFFVSDTDKYMMNESLRLIPETMEAIKNTPIDHNLEPVNLQRAISMLNELPPHILANIAFAEQIAAWQDDYAKQAVTVLNALRMAPLEQKKRYNDQLSSMFEKLLRNTSFMYNASDIVNEAQKQRMDDLLDSIKEGFFFRISMEDHVRKVSVQMLRQKIAMDKLRLIDDIQGKIDTIKRGVDRAYDMNMRIAQWTVQFYSYVKWLRG